MSNSQLYSNIGSTDCNSQIKNNVRSSECNMEKINFLSLDDTDIPDSKILTEYIPLINNYLLEIFDIRNKFRNNLSSTNNTEPINITDKSVLVKKIKIIVDLISIYNNPDIFILIKQYKDEKEQQRRREEELEKYRQNIFKNQNDIFRRRTFSSSSEEDVQSNVSEDEFEKDKVKKMLDEGYDDIKNQSMLMKYYNIKKHYYCSIQDMDTQSSQDTSDDKNNGSNVSSPKKNDLSNNDPIDNSSKDIDFKTSDDLIK